MNHAQGVESEPATDVSGAAWAAEWRSVRVLSTLTRQFREGWRAVPAPARRTWLVTLTLGMVLELAVVVAVAAVGSHRVGNGPMPGEVLLDLRLLHSLGIGFTTALWLQTVGTDIPLLIVLLATAGPLAWRGRSLEALTIVLAWVLVYVVVDASWMVWPRQRPTLIGGGLAAPGFASFPSGHTAKSFAVYGVLAFLWARSTRSISERVVVFLLACGLGVCAGIGRLAMGAHWPSDVAGGAVIGLLMLLVLCLGLTRADAAGRRQLPSRS